ncbi:MAG: gliding motility-associated C-terminal domain-containing protein [Saprospiraceae bacterium]|nr:gliding motility-associated C-terminal domain-containing protein [Saprospiraceae bacterium]
MKNRFNYWLLRRRIALLFALSLGVSTFSSLSAQTLQFIVTYTGPDTIFVGGSCTAPLRWFEGSNPIVNPTFTPVNPTDPFLISTYLGARDQNGNTLAIDQQVAAGITATIRYRVGSPITGASANYSFDIVFADSIKPVFNQSNIDATPSQITVSCISDIPTPVTFTATDNCDTNVDVVYNEDNTIAYCQGGEVVRTWTATDDSGNSTVYTQIITVLPDVTPPVIQGNITNGTSTCSTARIDYTNWLNAQRAALSATDAGCGLTSDYITDNAEDPNSITNFCGSFTVTFTATDNCGLSSTRVATFTVMDQGIPTLITPASDMVFTCSGANPYSAFQNWIDTHGGAQASDDCGSVIWTTIPEVVTFPTGCTVNDPGATVTFVASDRCGGQVSTTATFSIQDAIPPTLSGTPVSTVAVCSATKEADFINWLNANEALINDGCTASESITVQYSINGDTPVDSVKLVDIFNTNTTTQLDCETITINGQTYNNVIQLLDIDFIASDACGNEFTFNAKYAVRDTTAPIVVVLPIDFEIQCSSTIDFQSELSNWLNANGGLVVEDECGDVSYGYTPDLNTILHNLAISQGQNCGETGEVLVNFFGQDACGHQSQIYTSTFRIIDTQGPDFNPRPLPGIYPCIDLNNQSAIQDELDNWLANYGGAQPSDQCGTSSWLPTYSWNDGSGNVGDETNPPVVPTFTQQCQSWAVIVTFYAVDECGNNSSIRSYFNVGDFFGPEYVTLPADSTYACTGQIYNFPLNYVDNCSGAGSIMSELIIDPEHNNCDYTFIRKWTAADLCGNITEFNQTITVIDQTPPAFVNVPNNITVSCGNIPGIDLVQATDLCSNSSQIAITVTEQSTQSNDTETCEAYNYVITRTYTATDACQNSTSIVQVITVIDNDVPTFTLPADVSIACGQLSNISLTGSPSNISDNCDASPVATYSDDLQNPSCENGHVINRIWTATDACGNTSTGIQHITFNNDQAPSIDVAASNATYDCFQENVEQLFTNWLNNNASAVASDDCGLTDVTWFAAVPGSYDINNPLTFPGTHPGSLNASTCNNSSGILRQETVDFVVYDICKKASVTTATFTITDLQAPIIDYCPSDTIINGEGGSCDAEYTLYPPVAHDDCGLSTSPVEIVQSLPIYSNAPGETEVPVETVKFHLVVPPPPFYAIDGSIVLNLVINDGDLDEPTEFFNITGENGVSLGRTAASSGQCGTSTTSLTLTADMLNQWAVDGYLDISLTPNIPSNLPGRYSVNDICNNSSTANISLNYNVEFTGTLGWSYAINDEDVVSVDPIEPQTIRLSNGINRITYIINDCANNINTCSFSVTVEDVEAPTIVCPDNIEVTLADSTLCSQLISLPLPISITDNCAFPSVFNQSQPTDSLLTYTFNPNVLQYLANDKTINFTGLQPTAIEDVVLKISLKADVDSAGEFFTIIGESNTVLGTTEVGQANVVNGDCDNAAEITFVISAAQFNQWTSDGTLTIKAISNLTLPLPPNNIGVGINPCNPALVDSNGDNDGTSYIKMSISYGQAMPYYYGTGATTIASTPVSVNQQIEFNAGITTMHYEVLDNAGNIGSCSFTVNVKDITPPQALCQSATIYVNPSGIDNYTMQGNEIDAGSTDNCTIASYNISPTVFTCNQAGTIFIATMQVVDIAGNTDECVATIRVENERPQPGYVADPCGGGSLSLFANPPVANGNVYTYHWSGPNGFVSNIDNPVILNASSINAGSYSVTVTGVSGCSAVGVVEVSIVSQPATPTVTLQDNISCAGHPLVLNTQPYSGSSVVYEWYQGIYPNGVLSSTTNVPQLVFPNPTVGTYSYYVIININGCRSNPSSSLNVNVRTTPNSTFLNPNPIIICEGEFISLGAEEAGLGYVYQWTGPNGFTSSSQYPPLISAIPAAAGNYNLVVSVNGCASDVGTTNVVIITRPAQPQITQTSVACSGSSVTLVTSVTDGDLYTWTAPDFSTQFTITNSLTLNNVSAAQAGLWTVRVTKNGCESLSSTAYLLNVNNSPNATAGSNSPICNNATLQLTTIGTDGNSFLWNGPNNFVSFLQNPSLSSPIAGTYSVTVTSGVGCSATSQVEVVTSFVPAITAISNSGDDCANGDPVFLVPTVFPADDGTYSYVWTGPNGYSSNVAMPQLPTGTSQDNGQYSLLVISANGCVSTIESTIVNINDAPVAPVLTSNVTSLCAGGTINLTTTNYGNAYTYNWTTPIGTFSTVVPTLTINNATVAHSGNYSVAAVINGCSSNYSESVFVQVTNIPSQPLVTSNSPVCEGGNILLNTDFIPGATYTWTGPAGFTSNIFNPVVLDAQLINEGAYQVIISLADCQSGLSQPAIVDVVSTPIQPIALVDGHVCVNAEDQSLILSIANSTATPGATYTWYNGANNEVVGISTSLSYTLTNFEGYSTGVNTFYVVTSFQGCTSEPSIQTSSIFDIAPTNTAFAGLDQFICEDPQVTLNATLPSETTGSWTVIQSGVQIVSPESPTTIALSLHEGVNQFIWSLSTETCGVYSKDTVTVDYELGGVANVDTAYVSENGSVTINTLLNDTLPTGEFTVTITNAVDHGALQAGSEQGVYIYRPESGYTGIDQFTYEICNVNCPDVCSKTTVLIGVGTRVDCIAPTIITPNNDGVNDSFIITCFESGKYPNNEVIVFNQWGDEVFRATNYDNGWQGTYQGKNLPVGTYYYIVNLGDGTKPMAGFLLIER